MFIIQLLCLLCPYPQPGLAEGADLFVTEDGGETSCSQASPCTLEAAKDIELFTKPSFLFLRKNINAYHKPRG